MEKIKTATPNITEENVERLLELFPQVATEIENESGEIGRVVDYDALRDLLGDLVEDGRERYQFSWPGKRDAKAEARRPITKTLRPCMNESMNWSTTRNLYIEGDNLDALKILRETYAGSIKLIYIDPPYNTGNDFIYDDDFSKTHEEYESDSGNFDDEGGRLVANLESNGRFHSDWCSMIYPRLLLSRDLLTHDGIIFISIDNNEIANAKKICDEVFGEQSFVTILHVQMSTVQGQKVRAAKAGNIVKNAEYILVYSKDGRKNIGLRPLLDPVKYDNHYNKVLTEIADGVFKEESLTDVLSSKDDLKKELAVLSLCDETQSLSSSKIQTYYEKSPLFKKYVDSMASQIVRVHDSVDIDKEFISKMEDGKVYLYKSDNRDYLVSKKDDETVTQRIRLSEKLSYADDFYKTYGPTTLRGDWWPGFYLDMGNVSKEGGVNYDNGKKPIRLLQQIISLCTKDDDLVMDFFAGSSSTAHAVLAQNKNDNMHRRFIMIQLPEDLDESLDRASGENKTSIKNVIKILDGNDAPHKLTEIGKIRLRNVCTELNDPDGEYESNLFESNKSDFGFRVLKVDSSNMKETHASPQITTQESLLTLIDNVKEDRSDEDLLFQVLPKFRIPYSASIEEVMIDGKKVFNVDDGLLLACFDIDVTTEVIEEIARRKPSYAVMRDLSFKNDADEANFEELFKTFSPDTIRRVI